MATITSVFSAKKKTEGEKGLLLQRGPRSRMQPVLIFALKGGHDSLTHSGFYNCSWQVSDGVEWQMCACRQTIPAGLGFRLRIRTTKRVLEQMGNIFILLPTHDHSNIRVSNTGAFKTCTIAVVQEKLKSADIIYKTMALSDLSHVIT